MHGSSRARRAVALLAPVALALVLTSVAWAHAHVSPPVALAKSEQVFTLAVPNEEASADTTEIVLTPGAGFSIDSPVAAPGWTVTVDKAGSGANEVVKKITWSGGKVGPGQAAGFQFIGSTDGTGTYTFDVRQTYSNDKVVDWSGPESSDTPAPTIEAVSSLGGSSSSSTLAIVGVVLGGLALILAAVALVARKGGRAVA